MGRIRKKNKRLGNFKKLNTMKKIFFTASLLFSLVSCKQTLYMGDFGQTSQTQVVLSGANFKVLGSFKGVATFKKNVISIKDKEGAISMAKQNLLENAKQAGVELTGSRTLINITTDCVQNFKMVTITVSAEIIEFTK